MAVEKNLRVTINFYKKHCLLVITWNKHNLLEQLVTMIWTLEKIFFNIAICRSSHPEVFLIKGVRKICSKFTEKHPCRIKIALRHRCSPVNLVHIFRTPFPKNTSWAAASAYAILLKVCESFLFRQKKTCSIP